MDLTPGSLLERGKYRIIDTLGRGGFGITYLAEQVMAKRKVCIKEFFPKDYYKRDEDTSALSLFSESNAEVMGKFKAKFIKEAQTIASLDHSNIIHIHDAFEENNTAYYVMEYIDGESLSAVVKRRGALDEAAAVGYIRQVADALGYIHEQRIMHLDVKPGNVMLRSRDDRAILIDFGLSKHYNAESGEATSSSPVGVSHGFAPMEQYKSGGVKEFSPATDIYSLGATLYYLVTGLVPPEAADMSREGVEVPSNLSLGVQRAIRNAMNYWREDRPQSIDDFLKLLDDELEVVAPVAEATIIDVEPKHDDESTIINVEPKQTPQPKNEPKPKKSKRGLWIMLAAIVVAAVASFVLLGVGSSERSAQTNNTEQMRQDNVATYNSLNIVEHEINAPTETKNPEINTPKTDTSSKVNKPKTDTHKITPKQEVQPNDEIWYASSNGKIITPNKEGKNIFGAEIISNTYNKGLGIIKFDNNITSIGDKAFSECYNLSEITIPNSVTTIGDSAFSQCDHLSKVNMSQNVTSIGKNAFGKCTILSNITIPNSVTKICKDAFITCTNLTEVTIPSNVKIIENEAFYNCYNLRNVYCIANCPPDIGENVFYKPNGYDKIFGALHSQIGCIINVPSNSESRYKHCEGWCKYSEYIKGTNMTSNNNY